MVPVGSRHCNSQASCPQDVFYSTRNESVYQRTKDCRGIQKARILHCQGKLLMIYGIAIIILVAIYIVLDDGE